jgi:hypothetical protein
MTPEDLKTYEEIARKAFYGYRNELGWGVPQGEFHGAVQFSAQLHKAADESLNLPDFFALRYSFYGMTGNEFIHGIDYSLKGDASDSTHLALRAKQLAEFCLVAYLAVYVCDMGLAQPNMGKAA